MYAAIRLIEFDWLEALAELAQLRDQYRACAAK
jgi:hypothetical protein